jgi:uncharacterized cupin superfamily protein
VASTAWQYGLGHILEGEIWAMMDVGEALMTAGDLRVQRGTKHSWSNRSDRKCRIAFVLNDADVAQ